MANISRVARRTIFSLWKRQDGARGDPDTIKRIISVLCSESGSHDYTINRREASDLGLTIDKPNDELYQIIKQLHIDFRTELKLNEIYDPNVELGTAPSKDYSLKRALVESVTGGSHSYRSEGTLTRVQIPTPTGPQPGVNDQRSYEGWRHEAAE